MQAVMTCATIRATSAFGSSRLGDSLDGKTAPEVREQVRPFREARSSKLILDLDTRSTIMSSAGLRLLLLIYREAQGQGGEGGAGRRSIRGHPQQHVRHRVPEVLHRCATAVQDAILRMG